MKQDNSQINGPGGRESHAAANQPAGRDKQAWPPAEKMLRAMLYRLSRLSTIDDLPFENRLEAMRTSLQDGLPTLQLRPLFEEITRYLVSLEQRQTMQDMPSPALENNVISSAKFLEMLDAVGSPSAFVERIEPAKALLREDVDSRANNYFMLALQAFFDELNDYHHSLHNENTEMREFYQELTGQLQDIRQSMQSGEQLQQDVSLAVERVDDSISQLNIELEDSTGTEPGLPTLKKSIHERIKTIRTCVVEYRNKEGEQRRQSAALIDKLYKRIEHMEGETAALQARLREKDRQYLTDSLTVIPNRVAYEERIQQECERYIRNGTNVCLLVCDIDNFKSINDTYGHAAGDKVLKGIAAVLQRNVRTNDFVARFGGEEFVIIMHGIGLENGMKMAEKLCTRIEMADLMIKNVRVPVTLSGGVAEFREYDSPASLFERADNALYIAKECGKNRIESE